MTVDIIFSDLDGCLVPEHYDALGQTQREEDSERYFEFYRSYSGPQIVVCTGRAWDNTRGILARAHFFPRQRAAWVDSPVLCEHGMDIVIDPVRDIHLSLIDEIPRLSYLKPALEPISQAGTRLETELPSIRSSLGVLFDRRVAPITLLKKRFSLAVRIPFFEGSLDKVQPAPFLDLVREAVRPSLDGLIDQGFVVFAQSTTAIGIGPPVSKGDGVRYLPERYGTSADRCAYIGDSIPDIEGMREAGWAACPSNAVPEVRDYVESRKKNGYISSLSYSDAELEMLSGIRAGQIWHRGGQ